MFIKKAKPIDPTETPIAHSTFNEFFLSESLKQNIAKKGYVKPTPIQDQAISPILKNKDLMGTASTGTGKTAAFLIPIIDKIYKNKKDKAIIITPTRELAVQINDELKNLSFNMGIYSTVVIGGENIRNQIRCLQRNSQVVIGTPGRIKDLLKRNALSLKNFSIFVLDEVDMMVDIGFIQDIKYFISLLPQVRQSLFFSATIPPKVQELLKTFVKNPITISLKKQDTSENVDQNIVRVINKNKKIEQLHELLIKDGFDKVLIFGRTKHEIERLNKELISRGFKSGSIHGNKSQGQRQRVLQNFKKNNLQILLATDVASRGIDIDSVTHVINYDLPQTYEDYIHRIGRTGRANKKGVALTFID
ncbi:MAG: DEAD/DEAH box helicase [Candidatus Woesebacteria bacterium]|nr:MAG: DEAD/DEAH box helicase [Candidatus Woesebacteria bacterium]